MPPQWQGKEACGNLAPEKKSNADHQHEPMRRILCGILHMGPLAGAFLTIAVVCRERLCTSAGGKAGPKNVLARGSGRALELKSAAVHTSPGQPAHGTLHKHCSFARLGPPLGELCEALSPIRRGPGACSLSTSYGSGAFARPARGVSAWQILGYVFARQAVHPICRGR